MASISATASSISSSSSWTGGGTTAAGSRVSSGHSRPCRAIASPRTRSRPSRSRPCHANRATATREARSRACPPAVRAQVITGWRKRPGPGWAGDRSPPARTGSPAPARTRTRPQRCSVRTGRWQRPLPRRPRRPTTWKRSPALTVKPKPRLHARADSGRTGNCRVIRRALTRSAGGGSGIRCMDGERVS